MNENTVHTAFVISVKSMVVNIFLFVLKLLSGLVIRSNSLVPDAIHSLSDIFTTGIVMLGIKISSKPADDGHPYGHDKIEMMIALGLGLVLFLIGGSIGYDGIKKIIFTESVEHHSIYLYAAGMLSALLSIFFKEYLYRITIQCARRIQSKSMEADAWHHRTDAFSSIGSLVGVIGILSGYRWIDSVACMVISLFIFKAALDIVMDSFKNLVDHACATDVISKIKNQIYDQNEIVSLDTLKTRMFGSKIYLDIEITVDRDLSLQKAHAIAAEIHDRIETNIGNIKHCMIHVNPTGLTAHHHI